MLFEIKSIILESTPFILKIKICMVEKLEKFFKLEPIPKCEDTRKILPLQQILSLPIRPSARYRVIRNSLEFSIGASVLLYCKEFNGIGFKDYLMSKTLDKSALFGKFKFFGKWMGRSLLVCLPFFIAKQALYSLSTTNNPTIPFIKYPSMQSLYSLIATLPLSLITLPFFSALLLNSSLCIFSILYDMHIDIVRQNRIHGVRKPILEKNYSMHDIDINRLKERMLKQLGPQAVASEDWAELQKLQEEALKKRREGTGFDQQLLDISKTQITKVLEEVKKRLQQLTAPK